MTKYRCKEPLELLKYDDDGCLSENATVIIEVGDVFLKDDVDQCQGYIEDDFNGPVYFKTADPNKFVDVVFKCWED